MRVLRPQFLTLNFYNTMRTEAELREELAWLTAYKKEVIVHFQVIELSKHKHALLAAFYATIDHEIDLVRWALGEDIALWRDDFSGHDDMQCFFDSLPPSDFPRKPWPQELVAAARKAKTADVPALDADDFDQCPTHQWADEAANQVPFYLKA